MFFIFFHDASPSQVVLVTDCEISICDIDLILASVAFQNEPGEELQAKVTVLLLGQRVISVADRFAPTSDFNFVFSFSALLLRFGQIVILITNCRLPELVIEHASEDASEIRHVDELLRLGRRCLHDLNCFSFFLLIWLSWLVKFNLAFDNSLGERFCHFLANQELLEPFFNFVEVVRLGRLLNLVLLHAARLQHAQQLVQLGHDLRVDQLLEIVEFIQEALLQVECDEDQSC